MATTRGVGATSTVAAPTKSAADKQHVSAELRAAASAISKEWPNSKAFAAGLEDTLGRTGRMKDENRVEALHHFAGEFVARKLGLTPESEAKLSAGLGKLETVRAAVVELLKQFPDDDAFLKGLKKELRHAFPELAGSSKRPNTDERLATLYNFGNDYALSKDALGDKVHSAVQELVAKHPRDEDFLRGLRELVRTFPHRKALTGSMPERDQLKGLERYAASYAQSEKIKAGLATGGVERKGSLGNAPAPNEKPFSDNARSQLSRAFTKDAMGFFALYGTMQDVARGHQVPKDLAQQLDAAGAALNRMVGPHDGKRVSADVLNDVRRGLVELKELSGKLSLHAAVENPRLLDQFRTTYQTLVMKLAKDKGVDLTQITSEKGTWGDFRMMNERQQSHAALAASDPQVAAIVEQRNQTYAQINEAISSKVHADGRVPKQLELMGRIVTVGVNPRDEKDQLVYDLDGKKRTFDEFIEYRGAFLESMKRLAREPDEVEVPLDNLRSLPKSELKKLEGPVENVALTDDKAKSSQLTRIYETKWHDGQRVVVSGRFEGIYVDDLINANGRLMEGTAFTYDQRHGRVHGVPVKANPGEREPYATLTQVKERGVTKEKLFLQLPNFQGEWTEVRQAMRRLTEGKGAVPTIQYQKGSKNTSFYFDAKDFAAVKDAVGGLSLSTGALGHLQTYFDGLVTADRAVNVKNVANFSEKFIPGLKASVKLLTPQKEALAWLEANGNRGVVALDTGIGKTLTAIAQMQKLLRDGYDTEKGSNGRFLFVCPKALRGNVIAEIHKFLEPEAAAKLVDRLDVMSYEELGRATKDGAFEGKKFEGSRYVAAFFDETQEVNQDTGSMKSRAALALDNPHKVALTASPMEQNPMEAYVLNCVASNIDLRDPEQRKGYLSEMKRFRERYCETVGGRIVGVKKDPLVREELNTWMKQRIFFRDKREVPEFKLPELKRHDKTIVMSPEHEQLYRKATRGVQEALRALVSIYRDKGLLIDAKDANGNPVKKLNPAARSQQLKQLGAGQLNKRIRELRLLATAPAAAVPDAVKANPKDPANAKLIAMYEKLGYPTLDAAKNIFRRKLHTSPQSRAALFAESRDLVLASAEKMSKAVPGTLHAACLSDKIYVYKNGKRLDELNGIKLPLEPKEYRKDPSKSASETNRVYKKSEWQQFAFRELLLPDDNGVKSITMQGQAYMVGQNLQALDTVFHLDMVMNAQDISQREARVWRQGNLHSDVDVYELVPTFADPKDTLDRTVPELDQAYVGLYQELFDEMVKESQDTELGKAWFEDIEHKQASTMKVSRDRLELFLSPYLARAAAAKAA